MNLWCASVLCYNYVHDIIMILMLKQVSESLFVEVNYMICFLYIASSSVYVCVCVCVCVCVRARVRV
jgi:hypothetical protein